MEIPLQQTLSRFIESHSRSNPAVNELFTGYRDYHVVLLVLGGFVELLVVSFCAFAWVKVRRTPRTETGERRFERRTYLGFAFFTAVIGLFFALVLVANVTTVLDPWPGFESIVSGLGSPRPGGETARLFAATNAWIESGSTHMPAPVHAAVERRLSWQRPLAIACIVLAVAFLLVSIGIWRHLIRFARSHPTERRLRERVLKLVGTGTVLATLIFTVVGVSNMRGTIEPVSISVFQPSEGD